MKRIISLFMCAFLLAGCAGGGNGASVSSIPGWKIIPEDFKPGYETKVDYKSEELKTIMEDIHKDNAELTAYLESEVDKIIEKSGTTYEAYSQSVPDIQKTFATIEKESEKFTKRVAIMSNNYYRAVPSKYEAAEFENREEALDEFYDSVCEDVYEDFYKALDRKVYQKLFNHYYSGYIDDFFQNNDIDYQTYSDALSAWFDMYEDGLSNWYDIYQDGLGYNFDAHTDVLGLEYSGEYDGTHLEKKLEDPEVEK